MFVHSSSYLNSCIDLDAVLMQMTQRFKSKLKENLSNTFQTSCGGRGIHQPSLLSLAYRWAGILLPCDRRFCSLFIMEKIPECGLFKAWTQLPCGGSICCLKPAGDHHTCTWTTTLQSSSACCCCWRTSIFLFSSVDASAKTGPGCPMMM